MENLFKLLFFLFLALGVMVVVLEKVGKPMSDEQTATISRWILPLCALMLILSLIMFYLR